MHLTPTHLGSTTTLTGPAGWGQNWYTYQPFGQTSQSKTSFDNWNRFRFTGREADETGLYYYRDRYYAPDLGRFISEDPAGLDEFGNQYAYAGNNPVDFIDPFGDATLEAWYRHPGPFHGVQVADHVTLVLRDDGPGGSRKVYYWAGYPSKGLLQGWGNLVVQFEPLAGSKEEQALKQKGARKVTIFSDPMRSFQQAYARLELIQRLINTPPILYGPVPADGSRNSNSAAAAALEQGFGIDPHAYGLDKDPFGNLLPGWNLKINLHRPTTLH